MNKLFRKLIGATLGLSLAVGVGVAVGASSKDVSKVDAAETKVSFTKGTNAAAIKVNYNSGGAPASNNGVRLGTSKAAGSATFTIPSGTTTFGFYAVGWKGKSVTATLTASVGTLGSSSVSLTANDAATGTISDDATVAITGTDGDFKKEISISNVTAASTITISSNSSEKRLIAWDAYYVNASATLSSISVDTAPTNTSYLEGENFDPTGLVIKRYYSDSTSDTYAYAGHTSEFTFSPTTSTALTTSHTSVTITYGGKSTTQAITVTAPKTPASVASVGQTTTFEAGDTFAYGGTLTATYTDSSSGGVSPTSFKIGNAGINPTSAGTVITPGSTTLSRDDHNGKTVYVLYTENNTTVYTSYVITVNAVSSVTFTAGTDVGTSSGQTENTITKSGISFYCSSIRNSDAPYRLYSGSTVTFTSTIGNMAKIEFTGNDSSNKISNMGSETTGTLVVDSTNNKATWTGDASSVSFTMTAQGRASTIVVTLASTDPLVELDASSATSVSMLKGDSDTSIKVHVLNIASKTWTYTFDEDEDEGLSTSSYISVSAGAAVNDIHTLTITTKAVGSTVLHISVSGTACATTIPVTVAAKPAVGTMVAKLNSTVVSSAVECKRGGHVQFTFEAEDTDGNAYSIHSADINASIISGGAYGSLYGSTGVNGSAVGTVVAKYELKVLSTVYVEVTVNVVEDTKSTVNTITFNSNLSDTQGDAVDTTAVFATKTADTHFGDTVAIDDSELLFSYENNRNSAEGIGVFSYDFAHGSTVDPTHKSQTIYVFTTFDSSYSGSFSIIIEQRNDPLQTITISNVTSHAKSIARGSSFQLEITYNPANPTDGKEVIYSVDNVNGGDGISVSPTGLVSVSASSGLGTARVNVKSAHNESISDYVVITATLESMKYTVREAESWNLVDDISTLEAGDQVILTGVKSEVAYAASLWAGGNNVPADTENTLTVSGTSVTGVVSTMVYTLETGSESGSLAFKGSDGKYLYAASSGSNYMKSQDDIDGNASFILNSDGTVVAQGSNTRNYMRYNNTSTSNLFSCYGSTSTTGDLVTFYKKSGGDSEMDVTEVLFNGVHNNFGAGKRYEWSESCLSFNSSDWEDACDALKGITGYSNYKLNRAVGDMSGNEIEVFLAKYDYIIGKFGDDYDYLGRFAEGGINANSRIVNPADVVLNKTSVNTVLIISLVSVISAAAIGGYFFLRKRKAN